ncbi:MAG TPA: PP0621 family protein [Burkholderiaceae bacterium]
MSRILLLLALVALVFWWLGQRRAEPRSSEAPPPPAPKAPPPQDMLACAQCGLHLPSGEALPGRGGVFCSAAHRSAYEAAHSS